MSKEIAMQSSLRNSVKANPKALGIAIVVSVGDYSQTKLKNLHGTSMDAAKMENTCNFLKLAVCREHDMDSSSIVALLEEAGKMSYPSSYNRLLFAFSGHGDKDGQLIMRDGNAIKINDIISTLSTGKLLKMPRLFFFDACRGTRDDPGRIVPKGGSPTEVIRISEEHTNILVAYATLEGYRSYEEADKGGMWMSLVADKLREDENKSVADVLVSVNEEMTKRLQNTGKYHFFQQPEMTLRLNENVFLLKESKMFSRNPISDIAQVDESKCFVHQRKPTLEAATPDCGLGLSNISFNPPSAASLKPPPLGVSCRSVPRNISGQNRSKLNNYKQRGIIRSYTFEEKCDEFGFLSEITIVLPEGNRRSFSTQMYCSTKSEAQELAATAAVQSIPSATPNAVNYSVASTKVSFINKSKLNNLIQGELKEPLPKYTTKECGTQKFQCTVTHPKFGSITGSVGMSKRQAEDIASYEALKVLSRNT